MNLQLEGKVAFVAAASKGIGRGVARALALENCRVIVSSSDEERLSAAAAEIGAADHQVIDLFSQDSIVRGAEEVLRRHGRVDILVTNSPGPPARGVLTPTPEEWDRMLMANLTSVRLLVQAFAPGMKAAGFGRLLHLASTTGREPDEGMVLSNVARAGVLAYSKTLARELGPFGVTSNAVLTGGVMTDRVKELFAGDSRASGRTLEELLTAAARNTPVGFIATPEQFAPTIVFLASPLSAYLNGVNLPLDGGMMKGL